MAYKKYRVKYMGERLASMLLNGEKVKVCSAFLWFIYLIVNKLTAKNFSFLIVLFTV